jgi:transcriptional regulator with XRE-family HTH domain
MELRAEVLAGISKRMRAAREASGLTRHEVAHRLGKPEGTVERWENGRSIPRPDNLDQYAEIVGADPRELWFGDTATPGLPNIRHFDPLTVASLTPPRDANATAA